MIVFFHLVYHGGLAPATSNADSVVRAIAMAAGKTGVVIYVLITGYFLSKTKKFSYKKFLKLILLVSFYGISLYLLSLIYGRGGNFNTAMAGFFPLIFDGYWFVTVYCVLYLVAPFLNIIIKNISEKQHFYACILFGLFCVIFPLIFSKNFYLGAFDYFVCYYFIGAFVARIKDKNKVNKWLFLLAFFVFYTFNSIRGNVSNNDIWAVMSALSLFLFFEKLNVQSNFINYIAASTFSVYLIHDNFQGAYILFQQIFHITEISAKAYFPLYLIFVTISVFVICIVIDILRRLALKLINKLANKIKKSRTKPAS